MAKLGFQQDYSSWISPKDWSKIYEGESLGSLSLNELPPLKISDEYEKEIQLIDIIWFENNNQIIQAFEVEFSNNLICSKLLRISALILMKKISFNFVIPKSLDKEAKEQLGASQSCKNTFQASL